MPSSATFGRRAAPALHPASPHRATAAELSTEAEAFRRELASSERTPSEFQRWRRDTRAGRWGAWALSALLMAPGLVCFVVNVPTTVSAAVEVGGILLGAWLRRARRRRLAAVRAWEPDAPG